MPYAKILLPLTLLAVLGSAQNMPKDAATQQLAEETCRKVGPEYVPVYKADGMPDYCQAPMKPMCFFGAYKDPKTGADGCCGKGNGTFSVDPNHSKEGACCVAPKTYTFDEPSNTGSCCDPDLHWTYDLNTKVGQCCGAGTGYKCSCQAIPEPTTDPAPPPVDVPKKCPDAHGWHFTQAGVEYEIDCKHGWSENLASGTWTKAADIWECLKHCGEAGAACQGVNYWQDTGDCGFASGWEFPPTGNGDPNLMAAIPIKQKT